MTALPRLALLAGLALAGCATRYSPEGPVGGFRDTPLTEDVYVVQVRGNAFAGARWVTDAALVRAAELTRRGGFRSFVLLNDIGVPRTMGAAPCPAGVCTGVVVHMFREGEPGAAGGLDPDRVLRVVGPRVGYRPAA